MSGNGEPAGPFGNPDGSRADIEDLMSGFVDFHGSSLFGALATGAADASVRVLVGRLGAGKTVYLRRMQSFQSAQESVYADTPQQSSPATEVIVRVCQWFPERLLTEKWMQVWHRAILRSLATHMLRNKDLRQYVDLSTAQHIQREYGSLIGEARQPRSIYSQLKTIINEVNTANHLTRYLDDDRWDDLEYELGELLKCTPPIFFYLDAVDEEFDHAPMYWLRCQKGLFYQTMRLLRDHRLGGRLHLVICIREIVMSSVYRSEHAPRYHDEPHICILNWDYKSLAYLLREKIRKLPNSCRIINAGDEGSVENWLGSATIYNERRDIEEGLEDYLLRHTRLIPRDVVSLGNTLCQQIQHHRAASADPLPPATIRSAVSRTARRFGDSQLAQCANQIAADLMPRHAAVKGYSDTYIGSQEYTRGIKDDLLTLIAVTLETDVFAASQMKALQTEADNLFGAPIHLPAVLWQNGLLGYDCKDGECFYSLTEMDQFDVPLDRDMYVLHPCLLDTVPGLRSDRRRPVRPYRRS